MPDPFGGFGWICRHTVLPQCNLFFNQLWNQDPAFLDVLFPSESEFYSNYTVTGSSARDDRNVQAARNDAGTGVGSGCVIPRAGHRGSVGDVALMVVAGLSALIALALAWRASRRKAAVGRVELRMFLLAYALHSALTIITMSSILLQGSTALAVLSAVHTAVVASLFWILLGNALVATQVVEDGTPAALVPLIVFAILFFIPTLYVSLDTALGWTDVFRPGVDATTTSVRELKSIGLFILTLLWPALAAFWYFVVMFYVVGVVLHEFKPALFYILAGAMFIGSQLVFFLANQPVCDAADRKVNAAFISMLLDTGAVGMIYLAWQAITEDDWGEEYGYCQ